MTDILYIIAAAGDAVGNSEQGSTFISTEELLLLLPGVLILSYWIGRGSVGELANSPVRRNWLPYLVPFALIFVWLVLTSIFQTISGTFFDQGSGKYQLALYLGRGVVAVSMIAVMLAAAGFFFAGGVKGFGLDIKRCFRQFKWAVLNYAAVTPLVMLGLAVVELAGGTIEQHQSLITSSQSESVVLKVIIAIFVITIIPVFEEMMFRGMLQSMIVGYVNNKWLAIAATSIIFAGMHPQTHCLALFSLSMCLGYAYEKSGSLWRPIFIHSIFNGVSVGVTLLGQ